MYLWVKALHVVAMVAWMAGMLYLPRLFVYHAQSEIASPQSATFKTMELRLLRIIMGPAMLIVWLSGFWLAYQAGFLQSGWLHAKIALVLLMSGLHGFFARCVGDFRGDRNRFSARSFRFLNEVPTVLLIGVVILVIVRPL
jgi:protoporphyrinogen IX oxidase